MKQTVILPLAVCAALLAGCQSGGQKTASRDNSAAVALLQHVNSNVHTCWVRSKDKDFDAYNVIPELDTQVGKPRILLVDKTAAQGLPKLVIEAAGNPAKMTAYGPLMDKPVGDRITADVKRWAGGAGGCGASA